MSIVTEHLAASFQGSVQVLWQRLQERAIEHEVKGLDGFSGSFLSEMATVFALSPFTAEVFVREPAWLVEYAEQGELERLREAGEYTEMLQARMPEAADEAVLFSTLRRFRAREMARIIWRDFTRKAAMVDTTREVTWLAEASIAVALDWAYRQTVQELGVPVGASSGEPQRMVVLGMGKLGAGELNLSSDIDLIFAYPEGGETEGGPRKLSNHEFFVRVAQRLIRALDATTVDGFVFRTDMRLRPWGESGALVLSFDATEEYYQDQGRDWERYAMIKARVVAGDAVAGAQLMDALRPFTYRRYLDYSAFESLRAMKAMINREVKRKGMTEDVKLGPGGIREIEFIAQSFQLIRGGRDARLQERALLKVLDVLAEQAAMPAEAVDELKEAYVFLRNAEHAVQGIEDKQTQQLPRDEQHRLRVAQIMGFADWVSFKQVLDEHRGRVEKHFREVISAPAEETASTQKDPRWVALWVDEPDEALLREAGFEDSAEALRLLVALRQSPQVRTMQAIGRERLDRFMPLLLAECAGSEMPVNALTRTLPLVEAVVRRTAYLVLLQENPVALTQLVRLCGASPWIASLLASHPVLLDELINVGSLYTPPSREQLESDLRAQTLRIPLDDMEEQLEALRYFKLAHVLRVTASEVAGVLPLMKVSDYLTFIAETCLEYVLRIAWDYMVARHGRPSDLTGQPCDPGFMIAGYGKLGGLELGHGSDLDLVFLFDADPNGETDGAKSLDNQTFFTRLGQRIIHLLTVNTPLGALYEVDMRLRPSGASGMLVTSIKAFEQYQHEKAWTWEHQAIVRARPVAGDPALMRKFVHVREGVLQRAREPATVQKEVREMRLKMRDHLLPAAVKSGKSTVFPIKQGEGGIVDIEFMVQYTVLAWSHQHPALARWTDNVRILETLEAEGLLSPEDAQGLRRTYLAYRSMAHRLSLQQQSDEVEGSHFVEERALVNRLWQSLLGSAA